LPSSTFSLFSFHGQRFNLEILFLSRGFPTPRPPFSSIYFCFPGVFPLPSCPLGMGIFFDESTFVLTNVFLPPPHKIYFPHKRPAVPRPPSYLQIGGDVPPHQQDCFPRGTPTIGFVFLMFPIPSFFLVSKLSPPPLLEGPPPVRVF